MSFDRPRILFIDTGRKYELEALYGAKLRLLSERFHGDTVTSGKEQVVKLGAFAVHSVARANRKAVAHQRTFRKCRQIIRDAAAAGDPVDVIVSYDPLPTGMLSLSLSRLHRIPLMVEVNGDFTHPSNYDSVRNPVLRALKKQFYCAIERFVLARADGVKLLYAAQLAPLLGAKTPGAVIHVYPNFLDVSAFRNLGETKTACIIGFPFTVKGVDIAVSAFKSIADGFPDWKMEVVGWYINEEKARLEQCIGGHSQIAHQPPLFRQQMAEYIGHCGVVICASRTEGFPRVIKEAMHAGKPCVVSDVGGLPAAVSDGVNGLVFTSGNVGELAAQLRRLLGDAALRQSLGARAEEYARQAFSNATYLQQFTAHVEAVLRPTDKAAS